MLDTRATALSVEIIKAYLDLERHHLESGQNAWGAPYSNPKWHIDAQKGYENPHFSDDVFLIPVSSNGTGQLLLAKYAIDELKCDAITYPSNTFEGIKNTYKFLGVDTEELVSDISGLYAWHYLQNAVVVQTPIAGYQHIFSEKAKPCDNNFLLIDAAHGHFTNLEDELTPLNSALVYSFFATKNINIGGEGGLIVTKDVKVYNWLIRTLNYDKPYFLSLSLNARVSQANAYKMIYGFNHPAAIKWFFTNRVEVAKVYAEVCDSLGVEYYSSIVPSTSTMNGYKFLITDTRITNLEELSTSKVFDRTTYHVCPATYSQLALNLVDLKSRFNQILLTNLKA